MSQEIKNLSDLLQDNEIKNRVRKIEELKWTDGYGEPLDAENLNMITDSIADNSKIIRSAIDDYNQQLETEVTTRKEANENILTELKELSSAVKEGLDTIETKVFKVTIEEDTDPDKLELELKPNSGDILIVTATHKNDQLTGYIWTENGWCALNGNYDANNIYFTEDMTVTKEIGYITLSNGRGTIPSKGKNLTGVFEAMFVKEQNPTKTDPSVSVTLTGAGSYEVGTKVTGVKYSASFEDGKYTYGPEPTGAVPTKWEITATNGHFNTVSPAEGETTVAGSVSNVDLDDITVTDDTNFTVTAKATHTAGDTPKTNKGNDSTDSSKKITDGTKSKTSSAIKGYRSYFYGVLATSSVDAPLTSAIVREQLTNGGAYDGEKSFELKGTDVTGAKRIVIAIPSNSARGGLSEVILTSAMNTPVTDSYVETTAPVKVEGVDGATAIDYTVWVYEPAIIDAGEVHAIKLA